MCKVDGCSEDKLFCKGFCHRHYMQNYRGDPYTFGPKEERVWGNKWLLEHVTHEGDECLIWPYGRDPYGRAKGSFGKGVTRLAHRHMCALKHGPAPEGKPEAAHYCGNGHLGCVNPNHLRWATRQENEDDKLIHGTRVRGERVGSAILTEQQVRDIREIATVFEFPIIAQEFGVTRGCIRSIVTRKTWRHVA